jgi:hypothetical protein
VLEGSGDDVCVFVDELFCFVSVFLLSMSVGVSALGSGGICTGSFVFKVLCFWRNSIYGPRMLRRAWRDGMGFPYSCFGQANEWYIDMRLYR